MSDGTTISPGFANEAETAVEESSSTTGMVVAG